MTLRLFEAFGVEIEYMLVDRESFEVLPISDRLLEARAGELVSEVELGELAWSNELVLHVLEIKTNGPARNLAALPGRFLESVRQADELAAELGGRLLPGAMHPWMDPDRETRLWPHEYSAVYEAYDRIFDCRGHGWSNLQSTHLNLPFADDEEFGRLHAGIRLVLPLLPALAASSPYADGERKSALDQRLEVYRHNADRVPEVAGLVVPERAWTKEQYRQRILEPLYAAIAPLDPDQVLRDEFLNSRGAIARFSRGSIEIRVVDAQECPLADLAIVAWTVAVLRLLADEVLSSTAAQQAISTESLHRSFVATTVGADEATLDDRSYLEALGFGATRGTAGEVAAHLLERALAAGTLDAEPWSAPLEVLVGEGPLARRMLRRAGERPDRAGLRALCAELASCLLENRLLRA